MSSNLVFVTNFQFFPLLSSTSSASHPTLSLLFYKSTLVFPTLFLPSSFVQLTILSSQTTHSHIFRFSQFPFPSFSQRIHWVSQFFYIPLPVLETLTTVYSSAALLPTFFCPLSLLLSSIPSCQPFCCSLHCHLAHSLVGSQIVPHQ